MFINLFMFLYFFDDSTPTLRCFWIRYCKLLMIMSLFLFILFLYSPNTNTYWYTNIFFYSWKKIIFLIFHAPFFFPFWFLVSLIWDVVFIIIHICILLYFLFFLVTTCIDSVELQYLYLCSYIWNTCFKCIYLNFVTLV